MFTLTPCITRLFLYKLLCYSELILPPQQHSHVFFIPPLSSTALSTANHVLADLVLFFIAEPIGLTSRTDREKQEKRAAHKEARLLTNSSSAGVPELSLKARPKGAVSEYLQLSLCCCQGRWLPPSAGTRCSLRSTLALVWHGRTGDHSRAGAVPGRAPRCCCRCRCCREARSRALGAEQSRAGLSPPPPTAV